MFTKHFDAIKLHKVHHFAGLVNKSALSPVIRFMISLTPCNKHSINTRLINRKESSIKKRQHKRKE